MLNLKIKFETGKLTALMKLPVASGGVFNPKENKHKI
jgi:hypothetical protein